MPNYYLIEYSNFSTYSSYITYYATWSYNGAVTWSTTAPSAAPDNVNTFAVGITTQSNPPGEITNLGGGSKELPPPPNSFATNVKDLQDFKNAFGDYLVNRG